MILQLLFVIAVSRLVHSGGFDPCPEERACLYHACCSEDKPSVVPFVLSTMKQDAYETWHAAKCGNMGSSTTELFVRPLSNHKWEITLSNSAKNVKLSFGDSLTVMPNQNEAIFKVGSDAEKKIPFEKKGSKSTFIIDYPEKKLLDIFKGSNVTYTDKALQEKSSSSNQTDFWSYVDQLTPCDASLIIGNCPKGVNDCRNPIIAKVTVSCKADEGSLWFKQPTDTWQKLDSVTCDGETKEWMVPSADGTLVPHSGNAVVRCAAEEPSPCDDSFIINDCASDANDCTALKFLKDTVECEAKESSIWWLTAKDSLPEKLTWKQVLISCDLVNKTWTFEKEDGTFNEVMEEAKIRCALKNPEESTTTTKEITSTTTNTTTTTTASPEISVPAEPIITTTVSTTTPTPQSDPLPGSANDILRLFIVPIAFYFSLM